MRKLIIFLISASIYSLAYAGEFAVRKEVADSGTYYKITYFRTISIDGIAEPQKDVLRQKTYSKDRLLQEKQSLEAQLTEITEVLRIVSEFEDPANTEEVIVGNTN